MSEVDRYEIGQFCWIELSTADPEGAKAFYPKLFDWGIDEQPIPDGPPYITFTKNGKAVAAAFQQRAEEAQQGIPSHWNSYVNVDDVDTFAKKAEAAGGTVVAPPFDVMEFGRMAVVLDPTGAAISLWQSGTSKGAGLIAEHGALAWNELLTPDTAKAAAFYTELFGWTTQDWPSPGETPYTVFNIGEMPVGGLMTPPAPMPANWMIYLTSDDSDATMAKVKEHGGTALLEPMDVPGVGRVAAAMDPTGAAFGFMTPEQQ